MKIHSKFKDYYDTALAFGIDETKHWVRNTEIIAKDTRETLWFSNKEPFIDAPTHARNWNVKVSMFLIGVAGKVYPGFLVYTYEFGGRYCFSIADTDKAIKELSKYYRQTYQTYFSAKTKTRYNWGSDSTFRRSSIDKLLKEWSGDDSFFNKFIEYNQPIFFISKGFYGCTEIINPCLKDISFAKVMDPYTIFQEIDMFNSNVLKHNEPEMVEIADKYKRDAKGFDNQSFKTRAPGRKKPRRRSKK